MPFVRGWQRNCAFVAWGATVDGQPSGYPMGPDAQGLLLYGADGTVSAILHTAGRPAFGTRLFGYGSVQAQQRAAATYVSYAGTWELRGEQVHHYVHTACSSTGSAPTSCER